MALGWGDAETALVLGVEPVGASDWLAFGGDGVGPWLPEGYTTSPTVIGTQEPEYEQIAALRPDLILDVKSSGDAARHDLLAEIAPTIGIPAGGEKYRTTTAQQVTMIAAALGEPAKGAELLAEVDAAFTAAATEHPEFAGRTIAVGSYSSNGFGAYVTGSTRVEFATRLGFTNSPAVDAQASSNFAVTLSAESLALLDADLTVVLPIGTTEEEVAAEPLFAELPSVRDGRYAVLEPTASKAFSTGTVPALLWSVEHVVPVFADALP